jgi:hypothetical protein
VVLCKTYEVVNGELKCVVFLLLCVVNLKDGVMSTGLSNLFGLRGLCYNAQFETWVLVEV